jgi:hypothetical protein
MNGPAGWFPDPSGRPQLRWFDGWRWTEWVSNGGQVAAMPLAPPATGGGTLVTEPVLLTTLGADGFEVTTQAGLLLARAADPDGSGRRVEVAEPGGRVVLRLRRSGLRSTASVVVRLADTELGRFEVAGDAVRVLTRGALAATAPIPAPELGPVGIVDAAALPIGRIQRRGATWTTEIARPLGDPLHPLVGVLAIALDLVDTP